MLTILVVDDEEQGRNAVSFILKDHQADYKIIGFAEGVSDAFEKIKKLNPDLLLLDINLGDGTGFDLLKTLENFTKLKIETLA